MAERRPLVRIDGRTKELPIGDTLPPETTPGTGGILLDCGGPDADPATDPGFDFGVIS